MCWHKANFWTHKFQQEEVRGFLKKLWSHSSKENWKQYPEIKEKWMLIQFHWEKYVFATKPTTWQGVCLLYFKLIIFLISILLTWDSFYMIPEGFNPINPNQPRLLRVSCILLSMYSTKSPWNLQLQEWR